MNRYFCLLFAAVVLTACNTEPGGKEIGWRTEQVANNPETMLETNAKTSGHYRAWVGHKLMELESSWGEPENYNDSSAGGTLRYKKGREYENMNSETWWEYCEVTVSVGAGEIITGVDYQGAECRHSLMQFKYRGP